MLSIFIALSQTLVNAGFSQALIQKKNVDEEDYSSVFYINLCVSIILYFSLFLTAPLISDFYHQPILIRMTRVLALVFVINAFSYVQEARMTKELKFKTLMYVHIPSTILAGIISVIMALMGFGVWSIVIQQLVMRTAYAFQLWLYSKWKPLFVYNKAKIRSLFSFGSKLMLSGILNSIYTNIYLVVIGKFFAVDALGYYQNARNFVNTPTNTLSSVVANVTYPVFSSLQHDNKRLKEGYKRSIQQLFFWLCPALTLAGVLATPLFRFIMTDKWIPAVPYFQMLCIVGMLLPLNGYNLNIVNVKGRSDIFLKLEIIKKLIITVGIAITIPYGIWALIIFQVANSIFSYFLNSYYSGRFIQYPMKEQVRDILPILLLSISVGAIVLFIDWSLDKTYDILRLIVGFGVGGSLYWISARFWRFSPLMDFRYLFQSKLANRFIK